MALPFGAPGFQVQGFTDPSSGYFSFGEIPLTPAPAPQTALGAAALATVTGVDTANLQSQLFGKDIALHLAGTMLASCRVIEGPFLNADTTVDMIVTPFMVANPSGTRTITELRLNGTVSWTSAGGGIGPFAGMTVNINTGTEDQLPFASSVTRYGNRAVAYRSNVCVELKNCPLSVFANVIPFVSIKIVDTSFGDGATDVSWNNILAVGARYSRYTDDEFEFTVSDGVPFAIEPQSIGWIESLQRNRKILRNWNIVATDKLRVFENDSSDDPTTITRADVVAGTLKFTTTDALQLPRVRTLQFIDTDRDYDMDTVSAQMIRFPVPLTASQNSEQVVLPVGMTALQALRDVNTSLLIDDIARTKLQATLMTSQWQVEPGDIISFTDDPSVSFLGRLTHVGRRSADYGVDVQAEKIDYFTLNLRPVITSNGGLDTASITVNEGLTAVTTVTATDANDDFLTFSIIGGADAALFTINAISGALSFIAPPDFETPLDANADNVYVVIVQASDGALTDTQTISVTIADVNEDGMPIGGLLLTLTKVEP